MPSYKNMSLVRAGLRMVRQNRSGQSVIPSYRRYATSCKSPKGVVVGVYTKDGDKPSKTTANAVTLDDALGGKLLTLIRERGMDGTPGKGLLFSGFEGEYQAVAVVGVGKQGAAYNENEELDEGMENVRVAAGTGARALQLQGMYEVHVDSMDYPEQAAEGAALAVWRYNANKRKKNRIQTPKLDMYGKGDRDAWVRGLFKAESQNLARRLSDTPANMMTPSIFAQAAVDALCPCGVSVEVRSMDWIEDMNLNSFLMIAKGSCEPPLLLECSYCGTTPEDRPVLLLGQGLTFHSGGLCLKPKTGMDQYRGAMAGAAVCVGVLRAAAALSLPLNITAVMPLCEHMPSGMAVKCGDVVTLLNGTTMGIKNVDKAPVVQLADPLLYAQATYKPKLVIDIGTVAMGVNYAVGGGASGLWTTSKSVWQNFRKSGGLTGDRVWRFPLFKYYKQIVNKNITYDLCNTGRGPASSCLAAAILHTLVPCAEWAHLDIRGTGMTTTINPRPYLLKDSMTGRPTRTVIQFMYQMACSG
uniref:Cytosol aminopeptidase n=1 Tax=Drosophila melanogaster TaxID=7227 RepID=Q7K2S9_DROME|nr:loopin-1, isoform C [Drosophila melanogaster]NP_611134.1 loopin-1, isoform A [Drosophila melanogaster]AAF57988.1 loopin-1, isoform A [Drosophila melanogaster]AAL28232.1 GH12543p [Drosophila melanogaster]ABV53819.1 loopin-1, isoform C [Drosophila melanogaster]ACU00259.1 AT30376p [Drosophila melanogaster]|eukprot:NP_001097338.1 loopin-1, isoform C [Drosophila melanogaster]